MEISERLAIASLIRGMRSPYRQSHNYAPQIDWHIGSKTLEQGDSQ
ncbi:hypothetical protein IQ238_13095 [Pleurocapsales cyanobacterium LEGE 06147]|nr:hypothetical protein [Pleurocapsales cyanobacterium LEGE 06147]